MVKVNSRTIQRLLQGHGQFIREADEARRYYSNVNRIKKDNSVLQRQAETEQALGNPLHHRGPTAFRTRGIICS